MGEGAILNALLRDIGRLMGLIVINRHPTSNQSVKRINFDTRRLCPGLQFQILFVGLNFVLSAEILNVKCLVAFTAG